eukprot:734129-Amphidinium_carterae.1
MGLSMSAQVAACWIGSSLMTPAFPAAATAVGVQVWHSLHAAHGIECLSTRRQLIAKYSSQELEIAWSRLRSKYLEVWERHGARACTPSRIAARLDTLEAKRSVQ